MSDGKYRYRKHLFHNALGQFWVAFGRVFLAQKLLFFSVLACKLFPSLIWVLVVLKVVLLVALVVRPWS